MDENKKLSRAYSKEGKQKLWMSKKKKKKEI